jgi:hypothetical protein
LYRKLLPLSELHLDANVRLSSGFQPMGSQVVVSRFKYGMDLDVGALSAA